MFFFPRGNYHIHVCHIINFIHNMHMYLPVGAREEKGVTTILGSTEMILNN